MLEEIWPGRKEAGVCWLEHAEGLLAEFARRNFALAQTDGVLPAAVNGLRIKAGPANVLRIF